jgi:lipopolysaccharide export system protein LptC
LELDKKERGANSLAKQKSNMLRFGIISASVIVGVIIIIIVVYNLSMKPSKAKTEEIQKEAKSYISEHFGSSVHLIGTVYDSMGNMDYDYAAKAEDKKNRDAICYLP